MELSKKMQPQKKKSIDTQRNECSPEATNQVIMTIGLNSLQTNQGPKAKSSKDASFLGVPRDVPKPFKTHIIDQK